VADVAQMRGQYDIGREAVMERSTGLDMPEARLWTHVLRTTVNELRKLATDHAWAYASHFTGETDGYPGVVLSHVSFWCCGPEDSRLPWICDVLGLDQAAVSSAVLPIVSRMLAAAERRGIGVPPREAGRRSAITLDYTILRRLVENAAERAREAA